MILYFSGTGNSEYVAKRIQKEINDEILNVFDSIRNQENTALSSETPWIIVAPTYAWRIPRILNEWLKKTPLLGNREVYFVMTCGGSIANAERYLKKLCAEKDMVYKGCYPILMPDNYITMFPTISKEEALAFLEQAEEIIDDMIKFIKQNDVFPQPTVTLKDKISSGIVNDLFYPTMVHAKKFWVEDGCIGCGMCSQVCPLKNIHMEHNKPIWGTNCTHCMACISRCPTCVIEYGKSSRARHRYTCPK